jgi:hypothetical protein
MKMELHDVSKVRVGAEARIWLHESASSSGNVWNFSLYAEFSAEVVFALLQGWTESFVQTAGS